MPLSTHPTEEKLHRLRVFHAFFFPVLFLLIIWMVHLAVFALNFESAYKWGVYPQTLSGLKGVFFFPLLHAGFDHLFSNSVPLFVLGAGLFYFYKVVAYRAFFGIYFMSGIILWLIGREHYHIGASGLVYGLAAFLFLSGLLRKHPGLMAFSLIVVFLYGSMVWGMLPLIPQVSHEGHFAGAISGLFFAWMFRKKGTQAPVVKWEEDSELIPEQVWNAPAFPEIADSGPADTQVQGSNSVETTVPLKIVYSIQKGPDETKSTSNGG